MNINKTKNICKQLQTIQDKLDSIVYDVSDGVISANQIMNRIDRIINQIEDLQEKLEVMIIDEHDK